jgi:hypothetical protein
MHMLQSLFYLTIALHVSGIIINHLQEHTITVTAVSDNCYTVINRVKYQFQLFHDSNSQQYGMYIIHYTIEHTAFSTEYTLPTTIVILI